MDVQQQHCLDQHLECSVDSGEGLPLSTPLSDLVKISHATLRLRNSIKQAAQASQLPFETIGDYLAAGDAAPALMLKAVRSFGRKTARELDQLIHSSKQIPKAAPPETLSHELRQSILSLFETETLGQFARNGFFSTRLTNVMCSEEMEAKRFSDVLADFSTFNGALFQKPNCGRKSVNEFCDFARLHFRHRLIEAGYQDCDKISASLTGATFWPDAQVSEYQANDPETISEMQMASVNSIPPPNPFAVPDHQSLAERIDWLMQDAPSRERLVLHRRYGLGREDSETLEEIGVDLGITRERVRQIQSKILRRMQTRMTRAPISHLLVAETGRIWSSIAKDASIIRKSALQTHADVLTAYDWLALDLIGKSFTEWLDENCHTFEYGWLNPNMDREVIDNIAPSLEANLRHKPLPQPYANLLGWEAVDLAPIAIPLLTGGHDLHGYLLPTRPGAKLKRLVRLHAIATSEGSTLQTIELLRRHNAIFPNSACSVRDAEDVMAAAPHLFLEIDEGEWLGIGPAGQEITEPVGEWIPQLKREEEEGTNSYALQKALRERGPTRLIELLNDWAEILPAGRSGNSIGPTLLTRSDLFVRVLPGVYGLDEHLDDFRNSIPKEWPTLLNETQARLYAIARFAGEPRSIFPYWSADVEYRLCRWARHSGSEDAFASLLAIANVEEWGRGVAETEEWMQQKSRVGRFAIGTALRHDSAYERPSLDRLAAACIHAASARGFNWVAANRLTGRKIDSHAGAGLVALMTHLGILEEPQSGNFVWQQFHCATPRAAELGSELCAYFSERGRNASWDDGMGKMLAEEAVNTLPKERSWIDTVAISSMMTGAARDTGDLDEADPLEKILAEQRRLRDLERHETTLAWLLEDQLHDD